MIIICISGDLAESLDTKMVRIFKLVDYATWTCFNETLEKKWTMLCLFLFFTFRIFKIGGKKFLDMKLGMSKSVLEVPKLIRSLGLYTRILLYAIMDQSSLGPMEKQIPSSLRSSFWKSAIWKGVRLSPAKHLCPKRAHSLWKVKMQFSTLLSQLESHSSTFVMNMSGVNKGSMRGGLQLSVDVVCQPVLRLSSIFAN